MKNKQLIFINVIIFIILISVVRIGIKKENIAHAQFVEEGAQIQSNKEEETYQILSRNYHDFILTLEDIKHPPRFTKDNISNPDDQEEAIEMEDDDDEEADLYDQEIKVEDSSTDTEDSSVTPNNSGNSGNSDPPNDNPPVHENEGVEKVAEEDEGEEQLDEETKDKEKDEVPNKDEVEPEPEPEPAENPKQNDNDNSE